MKKFDISRLEHWRPINLRIGFALSLAFVVLAFSWTTNHPPFEDPYEGFVEIGDVEVIPPTTHPKKKEMPPAPEKLEDNFVIRDPILPSEPSFPFEPAEPEPGPSTPYVAKKIIVPPNPAPPMKKEKVPELFIIVEEMPRFQGCEELGLSKEDKYKCAEEKMLRYLFDELAYPSIARDNGIEGTVVIRFVVEEDGSISNTEILRDIGAGCGQEALRVVKSMPDWLPGKQRGRAVRVQYNLPVRFRLN